MRVANMRDDPVIAAYKDQANRLRRRVPSDHLVVDPDDVAQETYARFLAKRESFGIRHVRAYLARISTNVLIDAHRQQKKHTAWDYDLQASKGDCQPDDQFSAVLLKQVIASLPEKQRQVFLLSRFCGLSYPDIAARLGISVKTVEYRMSKALAHCVALLRD